MVCPLSEDSMKFNWNGEVGWEITSRSVAEDLAKAGGGPVEVELNTPGGEFFDGINIHSALIGYQAQKTVTLGALVASAGSVIALGFNKIIARDTSTVVIHNAWTVQGGDQNELRKTADQLEAWSNMIADLIAAKTGKDVDEIKTMLNEETWLVGQEIVDFGFADELQTTGQTVNKALVLASARARIAVKNQVRPHRDAFDHAQDLIKSGAVDMQSAWNFTQKDNLEYLGEHPYAKNGVVFRSALRSIAARATDPAIKKQAEVLMDMCHRKDKTVTKQEILDATKAAVENNQLTLKEIANALGLSAQLVGDVQNAVNAELATVKAENVAMKAQLETFDADRVKNALSKKYSGALLTLACDMLNGVKFADLDTRMAAFEQTESAKKVAAAMADVQSPLNRIDSREAAESADQLEGLRV
jgi:ATP-dependent protease ClpP protease subunit